MRIIHQFHPHFGMKFELLAVQHCWGEGRVSYRDEAGSVRTVPLSWTGRKAPDMFCEQSAGRSVLHIDDISGIRQLLGSLWAQSAGGREGHS
ncbi:MAG: hypothetical protein EA384_14075 [Spirochaetaceae bacterium]|nr:MAG: hypothetical protein EA384_14075 [Spirochaetaceae bacterium]